jgi:hypothetical protein
MSEGDVVGIIALGTLRRVATNQDNTVFSARTIRLPASWLACRLEVCHLRLEA